MRFQQKIFLIRTARLIFSLTAIIRNGVILKHGPITPIGYAICSQGGIMSPQWQ
jgi:hypothetical protein